MLTKEDYVNIEESLNRVFDYYNMPYSNKFTDVDKAKVLQILSPEFKAIATLNDRLEEEKFTFKKMTDEQFKILDYLEDEKYASIKGGAGTGKTTVALEKARRLSENGDKVLFLAYNKFLIDTLKESYKEIYPNVSFCSLFSLAFELKNSLMDKEEKVIDILKKYKGNCKYKHIVIDEGQDFESEVLKILYEIIREKNGQFYLFYDQNQLVNLKYRENNWTNPIDSSILKLKVNCRNTRNISEMSYSSIDNKENVEIVMKNDILGEKIEYIVYNSETEYFNSIGKILMNYEKEGIEKKRIVLISLKSEEDSSLSQIKKIGPFNLVKTIGKDSNKILKTTARKYKGLESDIVILVDLDKESIKDPDIEKLFYVTCSRARHVLHILSEIKIEDLYFCVDNIDLLKKLIK